MAGRASTIEGEMILEGAAGFPEFHIILSDPKRS